MTKIDQKRRRRRDVNDQNIMLVRSESEWPLVGSMWQIYHQTYAVPDEHDEGLYFWNVVDQKFEQLIYGGEASFRRAMRIVGTNGIMVNDLWDDNTDTSVDPGVGVIRGNNNNLAAVTEFAVSNFDMFDRQIAGFTSELPVVEVGDPLILSSLEATSWYWYRVVSVAQTVDFSQVGVAPQAGKSVNPGSGDVMELKWLPSVAVPS